MNHEQFFSFFFIISSILITFSRPFQIPNVYVYSLKNEVSTPQSLVEFFFHSGDSFERNMISQTPF
jgi:hypothetical protein